MPGTGHGLGVGLGMAHVCASWAYRWLVRTRPVPGTRHGGRRRCFLRFEAELAVLPTAEDRRQTPVFSGYRPDAWFGATEAGARVLQGILVEFPDDEIRPGETRAATVTVRVPDGLQDYGITLEQGSTFEVQEGARIVTRGHVVRMLDLEENSA